MKKISNKISSVRVKLFFTLSGAITAIIILLVLTNSIVLKTFYIYSKIYDVKQVYSQINIMFNENVSYIDKELEEIALQNNIRILIQADNGIVVFSSNEKFINEINSRNSRFPNLFNMNKKILYTGDRVIISILSDEGLNCILLSGKLDNEYLIYMAIPLAAIEESVRISNNLLLIMGVVIIIISAII